MITWNCRNTINLGRSFSTSGLRAITNSSPTGIVYDRMTTCDHRIFLTILQPRSIPKVVFVPITTTKFWETSSFGKTLFFSRTHSKLHLTLESLFLSLSRVFVRLVLSHTLAYECTVFAPFYGSIFQLYFLEKFVHYLTRGMINNGHFPTWQNRGPLPLRVCGFLHKNRSRWVLLNFKWCVIFSLIHELENRVYGRENSAMRREKVQPNSLVQNPMIFATNFPWFSLCGIRPLGIGLAEFILLKVSNLWPSLSKR